MRARSRTTVAVALAASLVASLVGCATEDATAPTTHPWPTVEWSRCAPEEQGVDSTRLASLLATIGAGDLAMHSLLVARHGCIVLDVDFFPYDGVRPHDVASCTKSLTSTAVGVALADGEIGSVDDGLGGYLRDRTFDDPRKGAVTLDDLLTMRAGFACDASSDPAVLLAMQSSADWVGYVLSLPLTSAPGSNWQYCSGVSHLLSAVVTEATGSPIDDLLSRRVFDRIGAKGVIWPRDPQGISHGWGDARLRPQDLARLGLLLLHAGDWDGTQLLDASWIARATSDHTGAAGPPGGYGYQWWVAPNGFYANGRGGQYLLVLPALDLVVVTTGSASPEQAQTYGALLNGDLLPALSADASLPPNPSGVAALDALVASARNPPAPSVPSPLPAHSAWASGRRFRLSSNPLGWDALTLTFGDTEAALDLVVGEGTAHTFVGLDSVFRLTRGVRFAADARYDDLDIALKGKWLDDSTFEVTFDGIDRIDAGTMRFVFSSGGVDVTLYEKTFLLTSVDFHGSAE